MMICEHNLLFSGCQLLGFNCPCSIASIDGIEINSDDVLNQLYESGMNRVLFKAIDVPMEIDAGEITANELSEVIFHLLISVCFVIIELYF